MDAWWSLYKAASIVPRLHCPQPSLAFLLSHCLVPFRFATDHRKLCVLLTFCSNSARRFILFIFYLEFPQRHPTSVLGHCLLSDYTLFMRPSRCSFEPWMLLSSSILQLDNPIRLPIGCRERALLKNFEPKLNVLKVLKIWKLRKENRWMKFYLLILQNLLAATLFTNPANCRRQWALPHTFL